MRRHRDPGDVGERRHDGRSACSNRGREGRKMQLAHRSLRHVDRSVIAPGRRSSIRAEVLRRRGDRLRGREVVALKAAHFGAGNLHREPWVFARAFDCSAPARVAGDVEHRRKGHREAVGRHLARGLARRALPGLAVERRGLCERHGEHGAVAVDHVEADQERNAEPRLLDGDSLHVVNWARADEVEQVADRPVADRVRGIAGDHGPRDGVAGGGHRELAELLGQRHPLHQLVDLPHGEHHDASAGKLAERLTGRGTRVRSGASLAEVERV